MKNYLIAGMLALGSLAFKAKAQLPDKVCVGYWENWGTIRLSEVNDAYNVICIAFLEADIDGSIDNNQVEHLEFTPTNSTGGAFVIRNDISTLQSKGKKVLISVGGANGSFKLENITDKNTFIDELKLFIKQYKVDGVDIDIERSTYICNTGWHSMTNPVSHLQYLVDGLKELNTWYKSEYGRKMIITMAPEIKYTVGALSPWGNVCDGAFLPVIEKLGNDLDLLMVQLYNSGSIYGIGGNPGPAYSGGSADFIVTAVEALIEGFTSKNSSLSGTYSGLPEEKIAVAVPACSAAAFSGSYSTSTIEKAVKYLQGKGSKPGSRTLSKSYPNLRGIMTWSINKDAQSCGNAISTLAPKLFDLGGSGSNSISSIKTKDLNVYPNPTNGTLVIESDELINKQLFVANIEGKIVKSIRIKSNKETIDLSDLSTGIYYLKSENYTASVVIK